MRCTKMAHTGTQCFCPLDHKGEHAYSTAEYLLWKASRAANPEPLSVAEIVNIIDAANLSCGDLQDLRADIEERAEAAMAQARREIIEMFRK